MKWRLEIERVDNGYLLTGVSNEQGEPIEFEFVIQDDGADELKSHEELLWEVMNYFGFRGSKHQNRLIITREANEC